MEEPQITREMMQSHASLAAMLGMQAYIVRSVAANGLMPVLANTQAHLEHQVELERKGIMFAAGPVFAADDAAWEGEGLFIIRAGSQAEAEAIAASDPMHRSGARTFSVRPWLINEGSLTVRLSFSRQGADIS